MSGQIAVGLKKGHKVDKRETLLKPGARKGVYFFLGFFFFTANFCFVQRCGKRVKLIRDLVRDVAGTAPYEKRMMELLKTGRDKRALKLSKRKVSEILSNIFCGTFYKKSKLVCTYEMLTFYSLAWYACSRKKET